MENSSDENVDRPTLPSIWELFRNELSEPASRYNVQTSPSSAHPLPIGQDRRHDGWVQANHPAYQDHPSIIPDPGHGPPLSAGERLPFIYDQGHQVPDTPVPTFYQGSVPQQYYPPPDVHQTGPGLHRNLGTNPVPPYLTSAPTPSADYLSFTDSQAGFAQTTASASSPAAHSQAFDETNPGANYDVFRYFSPSELREENCTTAKYDCQYCRKAFIRPSTLRIHLNSHTGEKPFLCPVEGCGRGFSVLSNMRRHARLTHAQQTTREGTAQLPGGETSSRDHQQTSVASSSLAFQRTFDDPSEDDRDERIESDHPE